jgi:hypothetical protein
MRTGKGAEGPDLEAESSATPRMLLPQDRQRRCAGSPRPTADARTHGRCMSPSAEAVGKPRLPAGG